MSRRPFDRLRKNGRRKGLSLLDAAQDFVDLGGPAAFAQALPAMLALRPVFDPILLGSAFELAEEVAGLAGKDEIALGVVFGVALSQAAGVRRRR